MTTSGRTDAPDQDGEDPLYEAAAGWVARLSSADATEGDREAFESWLTADPAHAGAYAEMDAVWHGLGHLQGARKRRSPKGPAGLALAAMLGAAVAYQSGLGDWLRSDLWSGIGDIEHAVLSDGSRIDLNTGTAMSLRFTETERRVELMRGEAVFDVAPDPARPFVVQGDGLSVRAVGTVFFVRADAARPVGVIEGQVEVATAADRHLWVSAGEAMRRQDGAAPAVVKADVSRAVAWRAGRLVFSGERLSDVLAELGRYRRGRLILLDSRVGEQRVTGAFDPRHTDDALDAIAASLGLRITRLTPLVVLIGAPV